MFCDFTCMFTLARERQARTVPDAQGGRSDTRLLSYPSLVMRARRKRLALVSEGKDRHARLRFANEVFAHALVSLSLVNVRCFHLLGLRPVVASPDADVALSTQRSTVDICSIHAGVIQLAIFIVSLTRVSRVPPGCRQACFDPNPFDQRVDSLLVARVRSH